MNSVKHVFVALVITGVAFVFPVYYLCTVILMGMLFTMLPQIK